MSSSTFLKSPRADASLPLRTPPDHLSLNCRHRAPDQRLDASEIRDIFPP